MSFGVRDEDWVDPPEPAECIGYDCEAYRGCKTREGYEYGYCESSCVYIEKGDECEAPWMRTKNF